MYKYTFLLLFLFSYSLSAQDAAPPTSLLSEVTDLQQVNILPEQLDIIDQYLQEAVDTKVIPGGVFLISRNGKIAYHKSFGNRSKEEDDSYRNDDIFRIASMTKAVTVTAIMQLNEQGKLQLDDPLKKYIPAFAETKVLDEYNEKDTTYTTIDLTKPLTLRHLLTHTSGIIYGDFARGYAKDIYEQFGLNGNGLSHETWSNEDLVNAIAKAPLMFQPGTKYTYGLNMEVLGRVVEVVSGQSLKDYFQEYIFDPLGMMDTHFYLPKEKHDRLVPLWSKNDQWGLFPVPAMMNMLPEKYPRMEDRPYYAGGGGLSSTAKDYALLTNALMNQGTLGDVQILTPASVKEISTNQLEVLADSGDGYPYPGVGMGLGFAVYDEENITSPKTAGTFEWGGYFNTKFFIDPEEKLTFVGMTQIVPFEGDGFWDRLYELIYETLE